jgi:hypothetical protein
MAVLFVSIPPGKGSQSEKRRGPIVRQVDRVQVESTDPKTLSTLFTGEFQLPEAWPLAETPAYASCALGIGNMNVEIYRHARHGGETGRQSPKAKFAGLALEPYPLENALREMKARGISHSPPQLIQSTLPDGTQGAVWAMVPLPSFSISGMSIFLYEYNPAFLKADVRRKQLGNRLTLNNGGPLGIVRVRQIVIATAKLEKTRRQWLHLLGTPYATDEWTIGAGPSIRLAPGPRHRIDRIILQVRSIAQAKSFLADRKMLDPVSAKGIYIRRSTVQGLSIGLEE